MEGTNITPDRPHSLGMSRISLPINVSLVQTAADTPADANGHLEWPLLQPSLHVPTSEHPGHSQLKRLLAPIPVG